MEDHGKTLNMGGHVQARGRHYRCLAPPPGR